MSRSVFSMGYLKCLRSLKSLLPKWATDLQAEIPFIWLIENFQRDTFPPVGVLPLVTLSKAPTWSWWVQSPSCPTTGAQWQTPGPDKRVAQRGAPQAARSFFRFDHCCCSYYYKQQLIFIWCFTVYKTVSKLPYEVSVASIIIPILEMRKLKCRQKMTLKGHMRFGVGEERHKQ